MNHKRTIYLDMDGVLADFNGFAKIVLQEEVPPNNHGWNRGQWAKLRDYPNLYRVLPKMERADEMVELARKFRDQLGWGLYMLTAVPKGNDVADAFYDKVLWQQHYYPDITIRFGPFAIDKQYHCQPGDILVDDRHSTCVAWTAVKGFSVFVTDYAVALKELETLFKYIESK